MTVLEFSTIKDRFRKNSYPKKVKFQISLVKKKNYIPSYKICIVSRGTNKKLSAMENH